MIKNLLCLSVGFFAFQQIANAGALWKCPDGELVISSAYCHGRAPEKLSTSEDSPRHR